MKINTNSQKIREILARSIEEVIERDSLIKKLTIGKKLRIKLGIDPTSPILHLGNAIPIWKLRQFQDLGHQIVLIIGDFTARIGDTSDKAAPRQPLSKKEIEKNLKTYKNQIGKILNLKKTEFVYNSSWFNKLTFEKIIKLTSQFTVAQMIERENFTERYRAGKPIGLQEFLYPLMQGYDSVVVRADVEIGGTDQIFNMLAGRTIQKVYNQEPQNIITLTLLEGVDGQKMSKSIGNIIGITDNPNNMFGKIMSMDDSLIITYFTLCTQLPLKEIEKVKESLKCGGLNPRDVKASLAKEVVAIYHGDKKAIEAEKEFENVFKEKQAPTDIPTVKIENIPLADNLTAFIFNLGLTGSKSEAQRLIQQKAVEIDGKIQTDWRTKPVIKKGMVIQIGKRKFVKLG